MKFPFFEFSNYNRLDKEKNVTNKILYMLNRSIIMFNYKNLPETIPAEILEYFLQSNGNCIFAKVKNNFYIFTGGFSGECNLYYIPKFYIVSNPYFKFENGENSKTFELDNDCILCKNDSMFMGLIPLYSKYCTMLNENEISMILASINKRIQSYISACDDISMTSGKEFINQLEKGNTGIIAGNKLFESLKINPINNTNRTMQDLFEYNQYLKASLFNEIGLSANFNMKRERLTQNEVEANSDNLYPLVDNMYYERKNFIEKINKKYNLKIEIEFNSSWDYRINQGENIDKNFTKNSGGEKIEN